MQKEYVGWNRMLGDFLNKGETASHVREKERRKEHTEVKRYDRCLKVEASSVNEGQKGRKEKQERVVRDRDEREEEMHIREKSGKNID